jgi:hypothetical protein
LPPLPPEEDVSILIEWKWSLKRAKDALSRVGTHVQSC